MTINPLVACQEVSLLVESISQGLVPRFIHIHFILIQEVVKRGLGRTHGLPPSPALIPQPDGWPVVYPSTLIGKGLRQVHCIRGQVFGRARTTIQSQYLRM